MVIQISIAVAALAFTILVIYLVFVLVAAQKTLRKLNHTLNRFENMLGPLSHELTHLIKTSNEIAEDTLQKSEALNPLFSSISDVGEAMRHSLTNPKKVHHESSFEEESERPSSKLSDWAELATLGLVLWQKFRNRG